MARKPVERDLAGVLQEERLLEFAPLQLLRFPVPRPGVDPARGGRLARRPLLRQFLHVELLVADVPTQHAALARPMTLLTIIVGS
jgi:hypothetical protein